MILKKWKRIEMSFEFDYEWSIVLFDPYRLVRLRTAHILCENAGLNPAGDI